MRHARPAATGTLLLIIVSVTIPEQPAIPATIGTTHQIHVLLTEGQESPAELTTTVQQEITVPTLTMAGAVPTAQ